MGKRSKESILIVGGSGMLGLELSKFFPNKKYKVISTYLSRPGALKNVRGIEKTKLDVTSTKSVDAFKKRKDINTIILCAAVTDVNACEKNKKHCYAVNVVGIRRITSLAKDLHSKLIYISTPMVFSGQRGGYSEKSKPSPINYYGKTKLLGEKEILKYDRGLVVRVNPIGLRSPEEHPNFIQWFFEAAVKNKSFQLFSDIFINPISTCTLVKTIRRLMNKSETGIIHLGSKDIVSKADIWKLVVAHFPDFSGKVKEIPVNKTNIGGIAKRPRAMWISIKKAQKFGYKMPTCRKEVNVIMNKILAQKK